MKRKPKPAFVTGTAGCYVLRVNGAPMFSGLNGLFFPKYRAAQGIANTINAYCAKHGI